MRIVVAGATAGAIIGIATDQWAVILVGLLIGICARWAYLLSNGELRPKRDIPIDVLAVLPNGVLALQFAETGHVANARLMLAAMMLAAGSTAAFVFAVAEFQRRFMGATHRNLSAPSQTVFTGPDSTVHVPPHSENIDVCAVGPTSPMTVGQYEQRGMGWREPPPPATDDQYRILGKLGDYER